MLRLEGGIDFSDREVRFGFFLRHWSCPEGVVLLEFETFLVCQVEHTDEGGLQGDISRVEYPLSVVQIG